MFLKTLRFKNLKRKIASTKLVLCIQNYISMYTQRIELFSQIINKPINPFYLHASDFATFFSPESYFEEYVYIST